jgi:hypothetical protein
VPPGTFVTALAPESETYTSPDGVTHTPVGVANPLPIATGVPVPPGTFLTAPLPWSAT